MTRADGKAVVEIEDTGIGMDEEFIRHCLFRPFESTKGLTGMGIGAYESKFYIEALGGGLQVQSVPGKGTIFRLELPSSD
jgi:signal transduction histidine kinase